MSKASLVKIPTKNNLPRPNYGPKKSDWLICPPPKSYWLKPECQKTLLVKMPTKNNLPGPNYGPKKSDWLICPPPQSYWLKPQYQNILLVEIPTKNNFRLPFGQHLCSFDPADTQASKQTNNLFLQDSSLREREYI